MEARHLAANNIYAGANSRQFAQEKARSTMQAFGLTLLVISAALVLMAVAEGPKTHFLLPGAFSMIVMGTVLIWLNTRQGQRD